MSRVPILCYHAVRETPLPGLDPFSLTPAGFEAHLDLLVERGWRTQRVTDFVRDHVRGSAPIPERTILITFDDGYADFVEVAVPMLVERGLDATLFVTTSTVGTTPRLLRSNSLTSKSSSRSWIIFVAAGCEMPRSRAAL